AELVKGIGGDGKFDGVSGTWVLKGAGSVKGKRAGGEITIEPKGGKDKTNDVVRSIIDGLTDSLEPLAPTDGKSNLKDPSGSGGLLLAMYNYRQLLTLGEKGFGGRLTHGGTEAFYLPPPDKDRPNYKDLRVDCDVLRSEFSGVPTKWYFAKKDETRTAHDRTYKILKGQLLGFETQVDTATDPCEVTLLDYEKKD